MIIATVTSLKIPVIPFLKFSFAVCAVSLKEIYNIQTFLATRGFLLVQLSILCKRNKKVIAFCLQAQMHLNMQFKMCA